MDSKGVKTKFLAITDDEVLTIGTVWDAAKEFGDWLVEQCDTDIITQASSLSNLTLEQCSVDIVISLSRLDEFPGVHLLGELLRVLKPGGQIAIFKSLESVTVEISTLKRMVVLAGFLGAKEIHLNPFSGPLSYGVKAKKPSWKIGYSFALKKDDKSLPKVQHLLIDNYLDMIDEDSLLTEEDLEKLQLLSADDCEVAGKTQKDCKNCTCGRAEEKEKAKLGLTDDQLSNPQSSACGSCGLGDTFRCSTCPYKGLPPFRLGEKVSLPENFPAPDI